MMSSKNLGEIIDGHVARNDALCKLLESKGVDLSNKRTIDLHFWADDKSAAHQLASALRSRGYSTVTLDKTETDETWSVEVEVQASVLDVIDINFIEDLAKLAMNNQGEFDGWGTEI
jgi:hypothetical protein